MRKSQAPSAVADKKLPREVHHRKSQENSEPKLEKKQVQKQARRVGELLRLPNAKPSKLCESFEKMREARNAVWMRQKEAAAATKSAKTTTATNVVRAASSSSSDSYTPSPYKRNFPNSDDDFERN